MAKQMQTKQLKYICAFCCHPLVATKHQQYWVARCPACPGGYLNQGPRRIIGRNLAQLYHKIRVHYRRATGYYNGICRNYFSKNSTLPLCSKPCVTHNRHCPSLLNNYA